MSVWILHLSAELGRRVPENPKGEDLLPLPLTTETDFSSYRALPRLTQRIRTLNPDMPPESAAREAESIHRYVHRLAAEDIVAVVRQGAPDVLFAEVTGSAVFAPEARALGSTYGVPVRWFDRRVNLRRFGKQRRLIEDGSVRLREAENPRLRARIRGFLPLPGNRFARWKWLLAVVLALGMVRFAMRLWRMETAGF